jgi:hypothetical protein
MFPSVLHIQFCFVFHLDNSLSHQAQVFISRPVLHPKNISSFTLLCRVFGTLYYWSTLPLLDCYYLCLTWWLKPINPCCAFRLCISFVFFLLCNIPAWLLFLLMMMSFSEYNAFAFFHKLETVPYFLSNEHIFLLDLPIVWTIFICDFCRWKIIVKTQYTLKFINGQSWIIASIILGLRLFCCRQS